MTTLELDVGDLKPRAVEFTASELVVTLADGRKVFAGSSADTADPTK